MRISKYIPIIILVLITLVIGFVIRRKIKNPEQVETQQLQIEEPESEPESILDTEGFTNSVDDDIIDATPLISEEIAIIILGDFDNDISGETKLKNIENYKNNLLKKTKGMKTLELSFLDDNWENYLNKTVNNIIGKFIIARSTNELSKFVIVFKNSKGNAISSEKKYDTFESALTDSKKYIVSKTDGKISEEAIRHLTKTELNIIKIPFCEISLEQFNSSEFWSGFELSRENRIGSCEREE